MATFHDTSPDTQRMSAHCAVPCIAMFCVLGCAAHLPLRWQACVSGFSPPYVLLCIYHGPRVEFKVPSRWQRGAFGSPSRAPCFQRRDPTQNPKPPGAHSLSPTHMLACTTLIRATDCRTLCHGSRIIVVPRIPIDSAACGLARSPLCGVRMLADLHPRCFHTNDAHMHAGISRVPFGSVTIGRCACD